MLATVATVAIGKQYEVEASRLIRSIGLEVFVFDKSNPLYKRIDEHDITDGLYHKSNFANYIQGNDDEPVIFCDADLFSLKKNPLDSFKVRNDTDIAFVKYPGKFYFPDKERQDAFDFFGYKINSGFMYFRSLKVAKDICTKWSEKFKERFWISKTEYDEYALMMVLMKSHYKIELLDSKWNKWELNTEEEIKNSDAIFFQSHNYLNIV